MHLVLFTILNVVSVYIERNKKKKKERKERKKEGRKVKEKTVK